MPRAGPRTVRRYSDEFKLTAVRLSRQPGLQVQAVAAALEIHPFMLSKWRKDARDGRLRGRGRSAPKPGPAREIARAQLADQPGIEKALRIPPAGLGVVKLLAESDAIRQAAAQYEPAFVKNGRPADFLEQLAAAMRAVEGTIESRATNLGVQTGSKAGIAKEIRRGRQAVGMLDTIVRVAFEGQDDLLRAWDIVRKVRAVAGGAAAQPGEEAPVEQQPAA